MLRLVTNGSANGASRTMVECCSASRTAITSLAWVSCLVGLVLELPSGALAQAVVPLAEPTNRAVEEAVDLPARAREVAQLVEDLGHPQRTRRLQAYQRLLQIGPPALPNLRFSGYGDNPDWRRLSRELIVAIQDKHGIQPVRCNGLKFLPFADGVWKIPPPGGEQSIKLGVRVTNTSEKPVRFYLQDTIIPRLDGPDGRAITMFGGTDHIGLPGWTPLLAMGTSYTVSGYRAKLTRSADGKELSLQGQTDSGFFFGFGGLRPGRHYLSFLCDCSQEWGQPVEIVPSRPAPIRQTLTMFLAIEIK
jgi:hypothetical protein